MATAPENYYFIPAHEVPRGVAEYIVNMAHHSLLSPGDYDDYYEAQEETPHHFFVATREHIPVGFATLEAHPDGTTATLASLSVLPISRHRGIGKALIDVRLEAAKKLGVTNLYIPKLALSNTLAGYYDSVGFAVQPDGSRTLQLG